MELPTYTNIWKIEKRLYKLYDFRLPMPLPIGQVAAFLAIAVPYMLILTLAGMPFSHTWVWLYVLPPGVLAWLVTRPVLEGKRLPELVLSQLRYLAEPRTWCRMAPLAEKDEIAVAARVWRRSPALDRAAGSTPPRLDCAAAATARLPRRARRQRLPCRPGLRCPSPRWLRYPRVRLPRRARRSPTAADAPARAIAPSPAPDLAAAEPIAADVVPQRPVWPSRPAISARTRIASAGPPAPAAPRVSPPEVPPRVSPPQPRQLRLTPARRVSETGQRQQSRSRFSPPPESRSPAGRHQCGFSNRPPRCRLRNRCRAPRRPRRAARAVVAARAVAAARASGASGDRCTGAASSSPRAPRGYPGAPRELSRSARRPHRCRLRDHRRPRRGRR